MLIYTHMSLYIVTICHCSHVFTHKLTSISLCLYIVMICHIHLIIYIILYIYIYTYDISLSSAYTTNKSTILTDTIISLRSGKAPVIAFKGWFLFSQPPGYLNRSISWLPQRCPTRSLHQWHRRLLRLHTRRAASVLPKDHENDGENEIHCVEDTLSKRPHLEAVWGWAILKPVRYWKNLH